MALDPDVRAQAFQSGRLWLLALVCASVGAFVVWRTDDVGVGILAFLTALGVFGLPLWAYERSRRRREETRRSASTKKIGRRKS